MNLKGSHEFAASAQEIWDLLMNPEALARITPGVDRLEVIEEDQYRAVAEIKIGPVKGSFSGHVNVKDKVPPSQFSLEVDQKSKIGNAKADIGINLEETDQITVVSFDGKVRMSGLLARTGQRVISGVANKLANQFFESLAKELETS